MARPQQHGLEQGIPVSVLLRPVETRHREAVQSRHATHFPDPQLLHARGALWVRVREAEDHEVVGRGSILVAAHISRVNEHAIM